MKFVIPIARAGVDALLKSSFSRGPQQGYKYIKREPYFVNGKMRYRYYYKDEKTRVQSKKHHDPEEVHEHLLIEDIRKVHENLASVLKSVLEITLKSLGAMFGFEKDLPVVAGKLFRETYIDPALVREKEGGEPVRAPMTRVEMAFAMLPTGVKERLDPKNRFRAWIGGSEYPGLKGVTFNNSSEDEHGGGSGGGTVLGWARSVDGALHILGPTFGRDPIGKAEFGSSLTLAEEVIWHESGHHVHYTMEVAAQDSPDGKALAEWKDSLPGNRISSYAYTNWKEDFAETFACAMSHPKQLATQSPERYNWMRENVLQETLPSRREILSTPPEELAWWDAAAVTSASRVLSYLRAKVPAPAFTDYTSDKDQFYAVSVGGRTAYLRMGPSSKDQEAGWDRMPDTTYTEEITGADGKPVSVTLPVHDVAVGPRFKAKQTIKEVYDENGRPLTTEQAYFYLGQNNEKVIEAAEKGGDSPQDYLEWQRKQFGPTLSAKDKKKIKAGGRAAMEAYTTEQNIMIESADTLDDGELMAAIEERSGLGKTNTHDLAYKMYTSLGFHAERSTPAKEKERLDRVVRAQKKWDATKKKEDASKKLTAKETQMLEKERPDFALERHDWAPIEIPDREFALKSGTFAFSKVKEAQKQPSAMRDPKTGKTLTRYDSALGHDVPVLSARVYEQENPDGTFTRFSINESAAFSVGDKLLVPSADGWERMTLRAGDSLDPYQIAREHKISAKELLSANRKYARGQFTDPVLAALVNPNNAPIMDTATLQQMLREAARTKVKNPVTGDVTGRQAWVTLRSGTKPNSGIVHIQVEFDGSGPPLVVGDYWARKLGKAEIRIDELLNDNDEITVGRIVERKPKKLPIKLGSYVRVRDEETGELVLGRYVNKREDPETGRDVHAVTVITGQGRRIASGEQLFTKVHSAVDDLVEGSPLSRRRIVEPLEDDVLLYMTNVPRDSGNRDTRGQVRILLPKDGSIVHDQLRGMPGVRYFSEGGSGGEVVYTISVPDIPKFRERLGGFVMGERVLSALREADARMQRSMREEGDVQVVDREELEGDDGNINPEGILKGLVPGDEGIQPGEHRIDALQKLAKNRGSLYAAHFMGTGKTALAIMAGQMMRNVKDPDNKSKLAPFSVKKRVLHTVPPNTIENWNQEFVKFKAPPAILGTGTVAGAQQIPVLPKRKVRESDFAYKKRAIAYWKEELNSRPGLWDPWSDTNDDVVIGHEYFRDHEEALRLLDQFDGIVVDEAHKLSNPNLLSKAVERWRPKMNLFLLLSGTPITNKLDILPRLVELISGGAVSLGSKEEFIERYLVQSAVLKSIGRKGALNTDLNPQMAGELVQAIGTLIDIKTTADIKGKAMPAVLLDENEPAHMSGQQATMYRAAMAALTPDERAKLAMSAATGMDEEALLSEEARKKVSVARSIANAPSYKAPDQRERANYKAETTVSIGNKVKTIMEDREFKMPSVKTMMGKRPKGWGGKWPAYDNVSVSEDGGLVASGGDVPLFGSGFVLALKQYAPQILGVDYADIMGKKIDPALIKSIKSGGHTTPSGEPWRPEGSSLRNPDYGPEGMTCRGKQNADGSVVSLEAEWWNPDTGALETLEVPVGKKFVRDPNSKAAGLFYDEDDWDWKGRFASTVEVGGEDTGEGPKVPDVSESSRKELEKLARKHEIEMPSDLDDDEYRQLLQAELERALSGRKKGAQGPLEGMGDKTIQRSPERRRQRAMFDLTVTHNNAKCDELESYMKNIFKPDTGEGDESQMIIFGNRIGSSVRTTESKMRSMGYMDVNEALGSAAWSSASDKKRGLGTRKFFVSYMGKSATLGDREINSEIFRRQQDQFGKDTGVSMFVWRSLYGHIATAKGSSGKSVPLSGEVRTPWSRAERRRIEKNFENPSGRTTKSGKIVGLEVPMRVMGKAKPDGTVGQVYVYESELPPRVRKGVRALERDAAKQRGAPLEATQKEIKKMLDPHFTDRRPVTDAQIDIFNSCQIMVASDAANVGLNWPCNNLVMYDSLFSPMEEWQRITRAARMLPPPLKGKAKPLIEKIGAYIHEQEKKQGFKEYEGTDGAMRIVEEAINEALTPAEKTQLIELPGGAPEMVMEAWFATRAFNKMATVRDTVRNNLKTYGRWTGGDPGSGEHIRREAITEADVTNEVIEQHLTPFDREIMKSRRYLVDVKRLTVSANMPVMVASKVKDPVTGRTRTIMVPTGEWKLESPVAAERAQLTQGRAKMVPYEYMMHVVQSAEPSATPYDFVDSYPGSLAKFSRMPGKTTSEEVEKSFARTPKFFVRLGGHHGS